MDKKKFGLKFAVSALTLTMLTPSIAQAADTSIGTNQVSVKENKIITSTQSFGENLAEELKSTSKENYDDIISEYAKLHVNPYNTLNNSKSIATFSNAEIANDVQKDSVEIDNNIIETHEIDDKTLLLLTEDYFIIDTIEEEKPAVSTFATTKKKIGTSSRTFYGSLAGNRLFDLYVRMNFAYNGSKAWSAAAPESGYSRGTLSAWQVSNFKTSHTRGTSVTTSYKAKATGNFHFGLEYDGNGLVIQEVVASVTVACSKTGEISRYSKPN